MGNVNMEAYQIHYKGNESVADKLKEMDGIEQDIEVLSDIVSIKADRLDIAPNFSEESAYSAGDLVYHTGRLWKFTVDHAAGAWDSSEVTAANIDMELSELKNTLTAKAVNFNPASGVTITSKLMYKCSNILLGTLWIDVPSTCVSASSELGTFDVTIVTNFRTIGVVTGPSTISGKIGHFILTLDGKLLVDNNYALPGAGEYKLDITVALSS